MLTFFRVVCYNCNKTMSSCYARLDGHNFCTVHCLEIYKATEQYRLRYKKLKEAEEAR